MRLLLIRHGETEWNIQRRTQGITDTSLTDNGLQQAQALARTVKKKYNVDAIYSSPLQRAAKTALAVAEAVNKKVIYDERLLEICFGHWEGMTFSELAQQYPDEYTIWRQHPQNCRPIGAETAVDVMDRAIGFLEDMQGMYREEVLLVVSHTVFLKMLIVAALHLAPEHLHSFRVDNASLSILDYSPERTEIRLLNDVCHLYGEER